ncbi:MAG: glucose-6-phosphate dehydrogenase [Candidatus Woesearchaeota archaeon]|nr:glucose-6-phosphate dehydrogenase [Candidatus Woesearchaeota archaeon]
MVSEPFVFVLFGATGDLAKKKLIPALFKMRDKLHENTCIFAIGRRDYSSEDMRKEFQKVLGKKKGWKQFAERIIYHKLEFSDSAAYTRLKQRLDLCKTKNRIFYLATPQAAFPLIASELHTSHVAERKPKEGWHRLVIEKPFGSDLKSARELNKHISKLFDERQVYRIDHYVGKSFVQEVLVLRFANPVFDALWNRDHIDSVQIVVNETARVGSRGGYYDTSGAIRDMIQNHLLQLLSITAMEAPKFYDAEAIRDQKAKVLKSVKIPSRRQLIGDFVRGQYVEGIIEGKKSPAYRSEKGVPPNSDTETYAAVKLQVKNSRWKGVPFYLRTGKALKHKYAEIVVYFKHTDCKMFCDAKRGTGENVLVIRIQPDEGVKFLFNLAEGDREVSPHAMSYVHDAVAGNSAEAYEVMLEDCAKGDQTLFTRWDFVEQAWKITDALRSSDNGIHFYPAGSHGPEAALGLMKKDHRDWMGNAKME